MLNRVLALTTAATFLAGAAFGAPDKKAPKVVEVKYCPIMNADVKDTKAATSSVVGKHKIYFCCPGCKPQFDKLSKAEKEKKVAEAVKKAKKTSSAKPASNDAPASSEKLVELRTCPTTGEKVEGDGGGSEVVGKYKVYFCCAGCQPSFDKLTQAEKEKKVAELAKK